MTTERVSVERKAVIFAAIRAHLNEHGAKNWNLVREQFPDELVGPRNSSVDRRFFRWVAQAQNAAQTPSEEKAEAIRKARGATKRNIPQAPSPSTFIAKGADAQKAVDIMGVLHITLKDIMMMREAAMKKDDDGNERIRNQTQLDVSIKRRMDIVNTFLSVFREIYDLQQMRGFYEEIVAIIVEEIHPLDPVVSERIMNRLRELNDREAMTIHASPS